MNKKVMLVFGTRPEAIKMCPLVKELQASEGINTVVCVTGQHREMLDQVLEVFEVKPDYDLGIMKHQQTLFEITTAIITKMQEVLILEKPDLVLVHGDTTTTFATSLACFYLKIAVGHVEAGLRTNNLHSPYPEEFNRQVTGLISLYHFAPTEQSRKNLLREGKADHNIYVTGNTAIDALKTTIRKDYEHPLFDWLGESRLILLTAHRRENLGTPLRNMFNAINRLVNEYSDIKVIYPVHMNPQIRRVATEVFGDQNRVNMIEPLDVLDFHNFMDKAYLVLTDSGGIQEEAPSLGKPVLVMRDTTERPEGVEAGTLKLVGTDEGEIYREFKLLLDSKEAYEKMSSACNPYGDGTASKQIVKIILERLALN